MSLSLDDVQRFALERIAAMIDPNDAENADLVAIVRDAMAGKAEALLAGDTERAQAADRRMLMALGQKLHRLSLGQRESVVAIVDVALHAIDRFVLGGLGNLSDSLRDRASG